MTSLVKKEKFSFSIEDYYIEHQGTAILDIDVSLEFKTPKGQRKSKDYYEFQQIINYIDSYLVDYPNETDYWEILNTNLATSLITDKIPTAWDTNYKLAKSVEELTVDIAVQAGSGGPAYTRTSSVTVQAANTKTNSATTPNGFGTHAEKARLRTMGDGRTQLKLTGMEPVDWLHPPDGRAGRRWNGRRLARHWDALFGTSPPRAQVSFHRDGTDGIVLMDVITTKPSRRSDQLNLTIEAVRPKDQRRLDALAANDLHDIVLWITEQPTSGMSMMDSYPL